MSIDTAERETASEALERQYDADQVAIEIAKRLPAAREAVYKLCERTPLVEHAQRTNPKLRVFTKLECMQPGKSFKLRGAMAAVDEYAGNHPDAGAVVTASAGNHLQGVAHAARYYGLGVHGHTASSISPVKAERAAALGVTMDSSHPTLEHALDAAAQYGDAFIHPYDQYEVMAGQATLLTELLDDFEQNGIDLQDAEVVIAVPVGGGGLLAGLAVALYEQKMSGRVGDGVRLLGVQMENCDAARRFRDRATVNGEAFHDGELDTACDGTAVTKPGKKTSTILEDPRFVDGIISVPKVEVGRAMQEIFTELRVMAEPAGALGRAVTDRMRASYAVSHDDRPLVLVNILSGANVSDETWDHFYDEYSGRNALAARVDTDNWQRTQHVLRGGTTPRAVPHNVRAAPYLSAIQRQFR